jgi:hypothetical protein
MGSIEEEAGRDAGEAGAIATHISHMQTVAVIAICTTTLRGHEKIITIQWIPFSRQARM